MTQLFWMTVMGCLLVLGCGEKGGQTVQESQSKQVKAGDVVQPMTKYRAAETETQGSAEKGAVDPALRDYVYPGSEPGGEFYMGRTLSLQYTSPEDFTKVVNYYKQKFPDTHAGSGTSAYFGKQTPDGSDLTVTLTQLDSGTQIILNLDKKL